MVEQQQQPTDTLDNSWGNGETLAVTAHIETQKGSGTPWQGNLYAQPVLQVASPACLHYLARPSLMLQANRGLQPVHTELERV